MARRISASALAAALLAGCSPADWITGGEWFQMCSGHPYYVLTVDFRARTWRSWDEVGPVLSCRTERAACARIPSLVSLPAGFDERRSYDESWTVEGVVFRIRTSDTADGKIHRVTHTEEGIRHVTSYAEGHGVVEIQSSGYPTGESTRQLACGGSLDWERLSNL